MARIKIISLFSPTEIAPNHYNVGIHENAG